MVKSSEVGSGGDAWSTRLPAMRAASAAAAAAAAAAASSSFFLSTAVRMGRERLPRGVLVVVVWSTMLLMKPKLV